MKINLIGSSFDINSGQGIYRYSGELFKELKKTINKITINKKGDVSHIQQPELIWKGLLKKNLVTTIHDIMPLFISERKYIFNVFFKLSVRLSLLKSKKIIAVSENTKKDILKYFKIDSKKIEVIYEGVSKEFFPIKKAKNKEFVIGYIGGLGKRKNVEFILKLAKQVPKIKFKIGGKGPDKERLESISKKLKLKNVNFVGFVPNEQMNNFYNSLDVFLFPSFYEGFGLPVVEAMACGIPCLISDRGSLPEIVKNAGIILDISDLEKSTEKMKKLIKNKKLRDKMGKEEIKRAKEFTWEKCAKKTMEVYKKVLK